MNPQVQYGYVDAPKSRSPLKRIVIILVLVLGLIIGIAVITKILNPGPEKKAENTANQFFNALIFDGDAAKAYKLTNDSFQKTTSLEKLSTDSTRLHKFYTQKFKRTSIKPYNGSLVVIYSATGSDGTYIAEAGVMQEKDGSKIQYYNIARKQ